MHYQLSREKNAFGTRWRLCMTGDIKPLANVRQTGKSGIQRIEGNSAEKKDH